MLERGLSLLQEEDKSFECKEHCFQTYVILEAKSFNTHTPNIIQI